MSQKEVNYTKIAIRVGVDVFDSSMQLFDQMAAQVFGPGRSDASPATAHNAKMPVTAAEAMSCLSGVVLLSEPGSEHPTTARIHLNGAATHLLTETHVRSISSSWTIVPYR